VASLALVALITLACATTATPSATPANACALVPNVDQLVERQSISAPAAYTLNEVDHCTWTYGADPARYVGLSVGPLAGHQEAIDSLGPGETVSGLGDDARWWAGNRLLSVAAGQRMVQVNMELEPGDNLRDVAVAIAGAALASLN